MVSRGTTHSSRITYYQSQNQNVMRADGFWHRFVSPGNETAVSPLTLGITEDTLQAGLRNGQDACLPSPFRNNDAAWALCWEHRGLRVPGSPTTHPEDSLHLLKLTGTPSSQNAFQPWVKCLFRLSQDTARFSHLYFYPMTPCSNTLITFYLPGGK